MNAKNPINVMRYLAEAIPERAVPLSFSENTINIIPQRKSKNPWAMSPNITPNKNGKVIVVNTAGLNSLYLGMP